jgi:hypothetical protein
MHHSSHQPLSGLWWMKKENLLTPPQLQIKVHCSTGLRIQDLEPDWVQFLVQSFSSSVTLDKLFDLHSFLNCKTENNYREVTMIWINMKSDLQIGNAQYTSAITVIIIIRPLQSFEIDLNLASKHYIQLHLSTPKSWPVPHRFSTLFLLHCVLCQNALSFCILYTLMNYITSHYLSWSLWLNTVCSFWTPILCTFWQDSIFPAYP